MKLALFAQVSFTFKFSNKNKMQRYGDGVGMGMIEIPETQTYSGLKGFLKRYSKFAIS